MSNALIDNLVEMERWREAYWLRHPSAAPLKLHWRATTVRHSFHVLPGESILELGAGSGLWTEQLASVLRHESPITAAVFNDDLAEQIERRHIPNTEVIRLGDLGVDLPPDGFDYVVGLSILSHDLYAEQLGQVLRLLKPAGQFLFFEPNLWNPQEFLRSALRTLRRWAGGPRCRIGLRRFRLMHTVSQEGFVNVETIPYDIVSPAVPERLMPVMESAAFAVEHIPGARELCGTLYVRAMKPGDSDMRRKPVDLAEHPSLFESTSVVVPCHNEAANIGRLVKSLLSHFSAYIREVVVVDDNSDDETAQIVRGLAAGEPRIKLIQRGPPAGVGRALRDGYAAAEGDYILSTDCDFVPLVPEFRDLFDVIAQGHDGALGSRFSYESLLLNYPAAKIIGNRLFHLLVRVLFGVKVRDVSNNLKLYRRDVFESFTIQQDDFAANAETGLKPLLAHYDLREVPVSWIERTRGMGRSSFKVMSFGPSYARVLWGLLARLVHRVRWKFPSARRR